MRRYRREDNYVATFQTPGKDEALLESDLAETFRGTFRKPGLSLAKLDADPRLRQLPITVFGREPALMGAPLMDAAELAIYVEAFRRTEFSGGINWYRAFHQNWRDSADARDVVEVPALMIEPDNDIFLPPGSTRGMERHIPDLGRAPIADCGHRTQREQPERVNETLIEWLERRMPPLFADTRDEVTR
jgi:pimeloyl-ACP methyl ester carboxylesterase